MADGPPRRPHRRLRLFCPALALLAGCATAPPPDYTAAAAENQASLYTLPLDLFGRPETGWAVYAPRMGVAIGTPAPADSAAFAGAVDRWRRRHGLAGGGRVDAAMLQALKREWQESRPFVMLRAAGVCATPPPASALAKVPVSDAADARAMQLRPRALAAYERMVGAARRSEPALAARPDLLQVFSAYRSPERDAARCAAEQNCGGVVRAACSAHRTGLTLDLVLDAAPGQAVDSSADANRLAMVSGLAYRWLAANAGRYGFVNYAFEPWHWEWTGERP